MARPLRTQFPDAFYHITCRGIARRRIFIDNKERYQFLSYVSASLETYHVVLHAYILMANHFYLLIQTRKANCSEFMRHFNVRKIIKWLSEVTRFFSYVANLFKMKIVQKRKE